MTEFKNKILFNARINQGRSIHLVERVVRVDKFGETFIYSTECGQRGGYSSKEVFYNTKKEVSCKKCLKIMKNKQLDIQ